MFICLLFIKKYGKIRNDSDELICATGNLFYLFVYYFYKKYGKIRNDSDALICASGNLLHLIIVNIKKHFF